MKKIRAFIDKFFQLEEINGHNVCPTYLYRWTLFSLPWFKLYLHHFVADDWSLDLHDHPKRFVTIGLSGGYIEETAEGQQMYVAPWIRTFPATHAHRLRIVEGTDCWTLALVFKSVRPWGFWHKGEWIPWRQYVESDKAEKMKSCS